MLEVRRWLKSPRSLLHDSDKGTPNPNPNMQKQSEGIAGDTRLHPEESVQMMSFSISIEGRHYLQNLLYHMQRTTCLLGSKFSLK